MPYSKTLNSYTFSLNQKTILILELYKKACDQYFKTESTEEKVVTDLVVGEKKLKKGFIPKIIKTVENINEKQYGANFVTLNQIDNIKLDPKADQILQEYTNEINKIYMRNKKKSIDLNSEIDIDSPALVFRILLLRLITIALSDDNTYGRDGETLLKVYGYFTDLVLCHIEKFGDEQQIFGYFASKEHIEWMNEIGQVVLAVKMIHSHQDNITECLTTLKSLMRNIECMILAYLVLADRESKWPLLSKVIKSPKIALSDFSDQFIENKLNEYENYLAKKNQKKGYSKNLDSNSINSIIRATGITTFAAIEHLDHKSKAKSILDVRDICENSQIAAILACKNNNCVDSTYQKLLSLYNLYFKTRCLLICLEQIDDLITTCSWVPLVMGTINLGEICSLMRVHCDMCANILAVPNNDFITHMPYKQTIMHKSFHAQLQLREMQTKISSLEDLQNPIKIQKIKYHVENNLSNLMDIQKALEISMLQYNQNQTRDKKNNFTLFNTISNSELLNKEMGKRGPLTKYTH